jgi:prevent-host-death family protein
MEVSVRELKNHLSKYLRRVQAGEDVVITSRGRPVARLAPAVEERAGEPDREELLRRLQTIAGVHLGKGGKPEGARNPIKIKPGEKTLSEIVLENRR